MTRISIITGGNRGLGFTTARALAKAGDAVVTVDGTSLPVGRAASGTFVDRDGPVAW